MDKICPLLSRYIIVKGTYDNDVPEMYYENCAKENCAWWTTTERRNANSQITDKKGQCAIVKIAEK